MKTVFLAIAISVISSNSIPAEESSTPRNDAYRVLRALEDFHHALVTNEDLASYRVSYAGGMSVDSRAPGVWPKGRVGCWQIMDMDGHVIANIQILKDEEARGSLIVVMKGVKLNVGVETYGKEKANTLAVLRKSLTKAGANKAVRIEDAASDKDIEKLEPAAKGR